MAATSLERDQLQDAFELFNRQSGLLEESYRDLEQTVAKLTRQLKTAQSARLAELVEKERISQHLSDLLDTLPGAIVVIDRDGIIRECNGEAAALLNQPLLGCAWATIVRREARDGGSQDGDIQLRDGRWLSLSRRPLCEGRGEVLLLADVTESRHMSALRQRQERLTTIGKMTASFAHQVRTPLASAMLYAGKLDTGSPDQTRAVQKIRDRLNDLGRMVNDMLGFAAGANPVEASCRVGELLADVKSALTPQLDEQTVISVAPVDPTLCVSANNDALKGALLNLVTNAIQACGAAARVELCAESNGSSVTLSVCDNGPGIPEDILPRVFEPFFTTRPQGTGLGLAVVKTVTASLGGSVAVESSAAGTRFSISLPVDAPAQGAAR